MLFPGVAEAYVPARARLFFAMVLSFLLLEPLLGRIPPIPHDMSALISVLFYEIFIGIFFGTFLRLMVDVLETTGSIVALQIGLSNASILNPTLGAQSALPSAFLSAAGLVLLFSSGLYQEMFQGIIVSYDAFPPGGIYMPGDVAHSVIHFMSSAFICGIQIAMPFIVVGLLMFISLALIQRVVPQVQLFMVTLPAQIWGGLTLMSLTIGSMLTLWLMFAHKSLLEFFGG